MSGDNEVNWCKVALNAWRIKKALDHMELAKMNSERQKLGLDPIRPWLKEICVRSNAFCWNFITQSLCPWLLKVNLQRMNTHFWQSTHGQSLIMVIGFFSGMFLSFSIFFALARFINCPVKWAFVVGLILSKLLCFGLAFSRSVRLCTIITLPTVTSRACRITILLYTVYLVYQHPMANFQNNVHVLIDSMVCVEQTVVRLVRDAIKDYLSPVKNEVNNKKGFLNKLKNYANKLRSSFVKFKNICLNIVAALKRVYQWFIDMVFHCNETIGGSPLNKCLETIQECFNTCWNLGLNIMCFPFMTFKALCTLVKVVELFCVITKFLKPIVTHVLASALGYAVDGVVNVFFFGVQIEYRYMYKMTQSKSHADIARDIFLHMKQRLQVLSAIRYSVAFIIWQIVLTIIYQTWSYHYSFYRDDSFDNYYITNMIQVIDDDRKNKEQPSILPLTSWEEHWYIEPASSTMSTPEVVKFVFGAIIWLAVALYDLLFIGIDFSFFSMLWFINEIGNFKFLDVPKSRAAVVGRKARQSLG